MKGNISKWEKALRKRSRDNYPPEVVLEGLEIELAETTNSWEKAELEMKIEKLRIQITENQ